DQLLRPVHAAPRRSPADETHMPAALRDDEFDRWRRHRTRALQHFARQKRIVFGADAQRRCANAAQIMDRARLSVVIDSISEPVQWSGGGVVQLMKGAGASHLSKIDRH